MRAIILAAAMALAGCASAADIYSSPVDVAEETTASPEAVSRCLQLALETAPIIGPDGNQAFLMKNGYGNTLAILTIIPVPNGTRVEVRKAFGFIKYRDCLNPQ